MAYNPYTGRWEMDGAQQIQLQPMPRPQGPQLPPQPPKPSAGARRSRPP